MIGLAGPVILAEMAWVLMGIVDTVMVGPIGPAAIGAVGMGSTLFFAVMVLGLGTLFALDYDLLAGGIYNAPVHRYHLSLAHTPDDVARTLALIDGSLAG